MSLNIFDSQNKRVGEFISLVGETTAFVQFKIGGKYYTLPVYPDKIGDDSNESIVIYTTSNCSGQKYISYQNEPRLYPVYVHTALGWITRNPDNIQLQTISAQSFGNPDGSTCITESSTEQVFLIEQVIGPDFREGFIPPFRFE